MCHILTAAALLVTCSLSQAAPDRENNGVDRRQVYEGRVPGVQLQPFTLDPPAPRAIRVAYNAPRQTPRAIPNISEDEPDQDWQPRPRSSGPTVPGDRAVLRGGIAYAPANAPHRVKEAIWAANSLRNKPYHWGGGHGSFYDSGYDCSGAVSYALHFAGALDQPLPSDDLMRYGERGRGRWITIHSRRGHTFAIIAGLRFDTTDFNRGGDVGPRWYTEPRSTRGFSARHPAGL